MVDRNININIKNSGGAAGAVGAAAAGKGGGMLGALKGAITSPLSALDKVGTAAGATTSMLGKMIGPVLFIAAAVGILVKSSSYLQRTIERIFGQLLRIVKPIGDVVATLLQPLIIVLTPFARAMNLLFKPFLQQANQLMRLGTRLFNTPGFEGEGLDLIMTGAGILLKPFMNVFVIAIGEAIKGIIELLFIPMEMLAVVIDAVTGNAFHLTDMLHGLKDDALTAVDQGIADFIKESDRLVLEFAGQQIVYGQALLDTINMHKMVGDDTKAMAQSIIDEVKGMTPELQKFLHDNPDSVYNVWVTGAKDVAAATKEIFDDLKSYMRQGTYEPGIGGGGSRGSGGVGGTFGGPQSSGGQSLYDMIWQMMQDWQITQQGTYNG